MAYGGSKAGPMKPKSDPLADAEESAATELASLAGVEDVDAFKTALSDYVHACIARHEAEETEEEA